jgi:hypothetical protein
MRKFGKSMFLDLFQQFAQTDLEKFQLFLEKRLKFLEKNVQNWVQTWVQL